MGAFQAVMRRQAGVLIVVCLAAGVAAAAPTAAIGRLAGTYPVVPLSGEFMITPNAELAVVIGSGDPFQSFCLEAHESITVGNTYEAVLNDEAILGGRLWPGELPGDNGGDLISPETAYLYTEFRAGTLSGYDYTPGAGRIASALSLQMAIWYLEGEAGYEDINLLNPEAQAFVAMGQDAGWTEIGLVRTLNLREGKICRQDMLTLASPAVPAPGALLLGVIATGLAGWMRRRGAF